jgi:hypothetical protein
MSTNPPRELDARHRWRRLRRPLPVAQASARRFHRARSRSRRRRRRHLVLEPLPRRPLRHRKPAVPVRLRRDTPAGVELERALRHPARNPRYINHVADRFDLRRDIQLGNPRHRRALRRGTATAGPSRPTAATASPPASASWPPAASQRGESPTSPASQGFEGATGTTPAPGRTKASTSPVRRVAVIGTGSSASSRSR